MVDTTLEASFAIVTPNGRGAIATVVLVGRECYRVLNMLFRSHSYNRIGPNHIGRILYGNWIVDGRDGEDLVVCPISNDRVEIHCHGGEAATKIVARTLEERGADQCKTAEFTVKFLGSEYLADFETTLIQSTTWRTTEILLRQRTTQVRLFTKLARQCQEQDQAARGLLEEAMRWSKFGSKLTEPWSVVLCGKPNVGKSSLANRLLGFDRAIVHEKAGTTRDIVSAGTAFDGWPVMLFDTAGLRRTTDDIEETGVDLARQQILRSDLLVLVLDATEISVMPQWELELERQPDLVVANKRDLTKVDDASIDVAVSAKDNIGIDQLIEVISTRLVPEQPSEATMFPISSYQSRWFQDLLDCVSEQLWEDAIELIEQTKILAEPDRKLV